MPRAPSEPTGEPPPRRLTPQEFAERFERSARVLWCVAAATSQEAGLAEDILQDAAMSALGRLETFDADSNFVAWMAQIVRYVALNQGRKAQRAPVSVDPAAEPSIPAPRPPDAVPATLVASGRLPEETDLFDDLVVEALGTLKETARACLLLKTVVELEYKEIAATLGIAEGTAMSHVHRARARMRQALELAGRTTPGGATS